MNQYRILCFGDSIIYGAWDTSGGWVDMLRRHFHKKYMEDGTKTQVFNLGIGGELSSGLLKRIENEIEARNNPNWKLLIVISTGANDSRAKRTPDNYEGDVETYRKNLERIIKISQKYTSKIVCVGLHAVNEKLSFKDFYYNNKRFVIFDDTGKKLCESMKIDWVEIHNEMRACKNSEELFYDMIHPNDKGHQWIFEKVLPIVQNKIEA